MTKIRSMIIIVIIQSYFAIPTIVHPILSSQFFFFAMAKYVSAFIEDIKMAINKFGKREDRSLKEDFIEMIKLHGECLE